MNYKKRFKLIDGALTELIERVSRVEDITAYLVLGKTLPIQHVTWASVRLASNELMTAIENTIFNGDGSNAKR